MYPSMLKPRRPVRRFAHLQDRIDELRRRPRVLEHQRGGSGRRLPALNVGTRAEAIEIYALAPGIESGDRGDRRKGPADPLRPAPVALRRRGRGGGLCQRTLRRRPFAASFVCPEDADPSRVEASYRNGVLKLVISRLEAAKPRQSQSTAEPKPEEIVMNPAIQPAPRRSVPNRSSSAGRHRRGRRRHHPHRRPAWGRSGRPVIGIEGRTLILEATLRLGEAEPCPWSTPRRAPGATGEASS